MRRRGIAIAATCSPRAPTWPRPSGRPEPAVLDQPVLDYRDRGGRHRPLQVPHPARPGASHRVSRRADRAVAPRPALARHAPRVRCRTGTAVSPRLSGRPGGRPADRPNRAVPASAGRPPAPGLKLLYFRGSFPHRGIRRPFVGRRMFASSRPPGGLRPGGAAFGRHRAPAVRESLAPRTGPRARCAQPISTRRVPFTSSAVLPR